MAVDAPVTVRDDAERHRFELLVDGEVAGFTAYSREGNAFAFTHTEIDDDHEGEGLGSQLVRGVLEQARANGASVLPYCPFVASYLKKHPELQDLVPVAERGRFDLT